MRLVDEKQMHHPAPSQALRLAFFAAKDLVFVGAQFVEMLDEFLKQVPEEEFMRLLPELRMAFTYFIPSEIDRIAEAAAGLYGKTQKDILGKKGIPGSVYAYGKELEAYVMAQLGMAEWQET